MMKPVVDAPCSLMDKMRLVSALSSNKPRELLYGLFMLLLDCDPRARELVECIDANMKFIRTRCIKDDQEFTAMACFLQCSKFPARDKERLMARLRENMVLPNF